MAISDIETTGMTAEQIQARKDASLATYGPFMSGMDNLEAALEPWVFAPPAEPTAVMVGFWKVQGARWSSLPPLLLPA